MIPDLSQFYLPTIAVLLILLAFVNGRRGYWKGRCGHDAEPVEDGGWADEARWWRERFEKHVEKQLNP